MDARGIFSSFEFELDIFDAFDDFVLSLGWIMVSFRLLIWLYLFGDGINFSSGV